MCIWLFHRLRATYRRPCCFLFFFFFKSCCVFAIFANIYDHFSFNLFNCWRFVVFWSWLLQFFCTILSNRKWRRMLPINFTQIFKFEITKISFLLNILAAWSLWISYTNAPPCESKNQILVHRINVTNTHGVPVRINRLLAATVPVVYGQWRSA